LRIRQTQARLAQAVVELESGPPSHDTVSRVLSMIDPIEFERHLLPGLPISNKSGGQIMHRRQNHGDRLTGPGAKRHSHVSAWEAPMAVLGQVKNRRQVQRDHGDPQTYCKCCDIEAASSPWDASGSQKSIPISHRAKGQTTF